MQSLTRIIVAVCCFKLIIMTKWSVNREEVSSSRVPHESEKRTSNKQLNVSNQFLFFNLEFDQVCDELLEECFIRFIPTSNFSCLEDSKNRFRFL
jgi:hypothetical protein